MQVLWALWAIDAEIHDDGTISIWRAYEGLPARSFPFEATLLAVVKFEAALAEFGKRKQIELKLIDEDAHILRSYSMRTTIPRVEGMHGLEWPMLYGIEATLEKPGEYALDILVGGESKYRLLLFIVKEVQA